MVDSNFANNFSHSQNAGRPQPTQGTILTDASKPLAPSFCHFCWGATLGLVIGALCGAYLPDRIIGAGSTNLSPAAFGPATPSNVAASTKRVPDSREPATPAQAETFVGVDHTFDAD